MRRKRIRTNVANINKLLFPFWLPDKNKIFPFFTANHLDGIRTRDPRLESHQGWHRTKSFFDFFKSNEKVFVANRCLRGIILSEFYCRSFSILLQIYVGHNHFDNKKIRLFFSGGLLQFDKDWKGRESKRKRERERVCVCEREGGKTN